MGNQPEIAKMLMAAGADPNAVSSLGRSALLEASGAGHLGMVRQLLEGGANPNLSSELLRTPLMEAARKGHDRVPCAE